MQTWIRNVFIIRFSQSASSGLIKVPFFSCLCASKLREMESNLAGMRKQFAGSEIEEKEKNAVREAPQGPADLEGKMSL